MDFAAQKHDALLEYLRRHVDGEVRFAAVTRKLYACPNISTTHRLVKLELGTPAFQRAPGESTGNFAIESAMDELAYRLNVDPLQLRLRTYADKHP